MDERRSLRRSLLIGGASLATLIVAAGFAPGAGAAGEVTGRARASAAGIEEFAAQAGASVFGDQIADVEMPLARAALETFGGTTALAAAPYPGDVVANVDALCAAGNSSCPPYPYQARASFPASDSTPAEKSAEVQTAGPVRAGTMRARAREGTAGAHAVGLDAASAEGDDAPVRASGLEVDASVSSLGGRVVARAVSSGRGVSIAGGVVWIARYESVAEAMSDGTTRTGSGRTEAFGVTVAGIPVTLDQDGAHAGAGVGTGPVSDNDVGRALGEAGIDIRLVEGGGGPAESSIRGALGEAGGIIVTLRGPTGVTQRFAIGRASAFADVLSIDVPVAVGLPGGGTAVAGEAFAAPAPPTAPYQPLAAPAVSAPAAPSATGGVAVAATLPERRGLGLAVPLGILAAVMLASILLTYARWQLLDWLPRTEPGEES